jgi:hypothetical protein
MFLGKTHGSWDHAFTEADFHEATDAVAVVLAERFRVEPFQRRQTWEEE